MYYRRTRRLDVPLITDIILLQDGDSPPPEIPLHQYTQAKGNFREGVWPSQKGMRMWYKLRKGGMYGGKTGLRRGVGESDAQRDQWDDFDEEPSSEAEEEEQEDSNTSEEEYDDGGDIVTELDVLYGDGSPFWGFERIGNGPLVAAKKDKYETVDIVMRKGNPGREFDTTYTFTFTVFRVTHINRIAYSPRIIGTNPIPSRWHAQDYANSRPTLFRG